MRDPRLMAYKTVEEVMAVGSAKDGQDESWRDKGIEYQLKKAADHAMIAYYMYIGKVQEDSEGWMGHARNNLTRTSMGLSTE